MLFGSLAYFSYGLMYAYEEVLKETRNVMFRADFNFNWTNQTRQFMYSDLLPYTPAQYRLQIAIKYAKIIGTLMFIAIGLALYSLRRIRIMRAIGTLRNEDAFRVVLKRVNSLTLDFKEEKMQVVGGATPQSSKSRNRKSNKEVLKLEQVTVGEESLSVDEMQMKKKKPMRLLGDVEKKQTGTFGFN